MKLACCAYSYRDLLTTGKMTLEQFLDTAVELGLDGVELTQYYFPEETPDYLHHIKREALVRGLDVSGTAVGGDFSDADRGKRRGQIEHVKDWIAKSEMLGSPVMRVFAGRAPDGVLRSVAEQWVRDALAECAEVGAAHGVVLALENHLGLTGDAEETLALVEPLDSPWVAINLDFGNFRGDMYEQFRRCAPRAVTTHAKVAVAQGDAREQVDYRRVVRIMREAGYRGYISIEYEERGDPVAGVSHFAAYLRGCLVDA